METTIKILPHNMEAEQALLGAILTDQEAFVSVKYSIRPEHFYRAAHGDIYAATLATERKGNAPDLVTVSDTLRGQGSLDAIGGLDYLAELAGSVPSTSAAGGYAKLIIDCYIRRQTIRQAQQVIAAAYDGESIDAPLSRLFNAKAEVSKAEVKSVVEIAEEIIHGLGTHEDGYKPLGLDTGHVKMDRFTGGIHPSEIIIIAGRTSMGKTAFSLDLAMTLAKQTPGLYFSLEMKDRQLVNRILASRSNVDSLHFRKNVMAAWQKEVVTESAISLLDHQLFITESAFHIDDICSVAHAEYRKKGIGFIVIDYVQIIQSDQKTIREGVIEIMGKLNRLKHQLNLPIILLAQVSRGAEESKDKRPHLRHLQESAALEQAAEIVAFLHRPGYYDSQIPKSRLEVILAKNRNGGTTGIIEFDYSLSTNNFREAR